MSTTVERVQEYTEKQHDTPNIIHLRHEDEPCVPGARAMCGAILKGVDHGLAWFPEPDTCVVCAEIAWGAKA